MTGAGAPGEGAPRPGAPGTGLPGRRAPLAVLLDPADRETDRARSLQHYGTYAAEILEHAGFPFEVTDRAGLTSGRLPPLVLLPYRVRLAPDEVAALRAHAEAGGAVIACGGVEGADELFGVRSTRRYLGAATLSWPEGGLGLGERRAPVWGAQLVSAEGGVGEVTGSTGESGAAFALRRVGPGAVAYLAVDVCRSVVTMQQGRPVTGDGADAPDGTAKLTDRILKTDDGTVIGWEWRQEGPEGPAYLVPYADQLRELLLAAIVRCAQETGVALAVKWYWPDGLPAVGCLSYDTDSNEDPDGREFLAAVRELGVEGTWCVMYPGGYTRALYEEIQAYGDEIALHYDALTADLNGAEHCGWSREDLAHQLAWLKEETSVAEVVSQKNHVTRWEGWTELFRWLAEAGIRVDQTKGPSKIGNLGFAFGNCHPWRPIDDAVNGYRLIDLLEVAFLTHDMWTSERRVALRRRLLDAVAAHNGVAHFIFHPQRIREDGMRAALGDVVAYGRSLGVPWWTSARIDAWERARRRAGVSWDRERGLRVEDAPAGLTVALFGAVEGVGGEPFEAFGARGVRLTL